MGRDRMGWHWLGLGGQWVSMYHHPYLSTPSKYSSLTIPYKQPKQRGKYPSPSLENPETPSFALYAMSFPPPSHFPSFSQSVMSVPPDRKEQEQAHLSD